MVGRLRRLALGISPDEASFAVRGFRVGDPRVCQRLECGGRSFIEGYLAALETGGADRIAVSLERVAPEFRGFAFEGAAMGFALLDGITPWRRSRLERFMHGAASPHVYMAHVGAGWALARLPHWRRRVTVYLGRFDRLFRWLVVDGYGFHEGFFRWREFFLDHAQPSGLRGYERRAFDQGLGRCLWFVAGGDPARVVELIDGIPADRHADLWSGLGLACTYAGGAGEDTLVQLCREADAFRPDMRQGAAFAAKARQRAGNPAADTDLACDIVCGMTTAEAAAVTDEALEDLPPDPADPDIDAGPGGREPAYETWRRRIRERFAQAGVRRSYAPGTSGVHLAASS